MRSILVTVMLIMVVALMFVNIISKQGGLRTQIETQGTKATADVGALTP